MSNTNATPRRVRVERNIYKRPTGVFEVGWKDGSGKQRWRTVEGGIQAARALRDEMLARRGRGERVALNPRLRFGEAAERWLDGPVAELKPTTQAGYRNAVELHLNPNFRMRRLDSITPDDVAGLLGDLQRRGQSEWSRAKILGALSRVYSFSARRLGWSGTSPVSVLERSERPKPSKSPNRAIFEGEQLEQTIAAANEPFRTLFVVAMVTGARVSEICALTWGDIRMDQIADAEIEFSKQLTRQGEFDSTKTEQSARTVPIPEVVARRLKEHRVASRHSDLTDFVFATSTGRAIGQRNIARALRAAQTKAVDERGRPTFPVLHLEDERGEKIKPERGAVPSMHSFRHTLASRSLLAGESVDEVAFLLGHANGNVTRSTYVREIHDARRRAMRRSRTMEEFGAALEAATSVSGSRPHTGRGR